MHVSNIHPDMNCKGKKYMIFGAGTRTQLSRREREREREKHMKKPLSHCERYGIKTPRETKKRKMKNWNEK